MNTGVIIFFCIVGGIVAVVVSWCAGYSMGQKDAYLDYLENEEYYDWIMEVKRKQNWE